MLWRGPKRAFCSVLTSNLVKMKQFYKEKWTRIPLLYSKRLTASNHEHLIQIVATKIGQTSNYAWWSFSEVRNVFAESEILLLV